jgi:hypothetical protein
MNFYGPVPNRFEGWGRLNLGNIFSEDVHHTFIDQSIMLTERGEQKEWYIQPTCYDKPVKITLAWTDPPGAVGTGKTMSSSAVVNKLVLQVEADERVYKGNVFQNGWSSEHGSAPHKDGADNVQNVFLQPTDISGPIKITITALELTTDCLTGQADSPQQDFALVISGGQPYERMTPADVFIVVDSAASGSANPDNPSDFSAEPSDNADDNWWEENNSGGSKNEPAAGDEDTSPSEDGWWTSDDQDISTPEAQRSPSRPSPAKDKDFSQSLRAGFDLLADRGAHQVVLGSNAAAEAGGGTPTLTRVLPETERVLAHETLVSGVEKPLGTALASLMANWSSFGASTDGKIVRRRVGMVVVGDGTRVTREDITAMRRLSTMGMLYILSDSSAVLAYLAQHIHRRSGIQFRLANDVQELGQLARDTLAEISGAQAAAVERQFKTMKPADTTVVSKHSFLMVKADCRLSIRIRYKEPAVIEQIRLQRPGQSFRKLDLSSAVDGMTITKQSGVLQIGIDAPPVPANWVGRWQMEVTQTYIKELDPEPIKMPDNWARVSVWANGPRLGLYQQYDLTKESSRDVEELSVMVKGEPGTTFNNVTIKSPRVIAGQGAPEAARERDVSISAQASRLDRLASTTGGTARAASEATREQLASSFLSGWIKSPKVSTGARVLDIAVQTKGADDTGSLFERLLRTNLIRLEPRSSVRKRRVRSAARSVVINNVKVSEVVYDDSVITGLTLQRDGHKRTIRVGSPALSEELKHIDLKFSKLLFQASESELLAVIKPLSISLAPWAIGSGSEYDA